RYIFLIFMAAIHVTAPAQALKRTVTRPESSAGAKIHVHAATEWVSLHRWGLQNLRAGSYS
ncbi:MAG: hypothetical protein K2I19_02665, partial [Muribaculaceae bacterium]|nr:hypothetical protein [Muribaculaceae bacterium]